MREFLLSHKVVSIALPLVGVVAVIIGELASSTTACILVGIIAVWLICAIIYWWRSKKKIQSKFTDSGLLVSIKSEVVKITINVKSEDIQGSGLVEKGTSTEIVDSSTGVGIGSRQKSNKNQ